jgi:RNA polymerase sigma-70 factor (ECF subfamily)
MLEVRGGSPTAFEELVVRYQARLVRFFENLVGRREAAEDLAQDVFVRVYRAREDYLPGAKFATWLWTIANNVKSNAMRDRARRPEVTLAGSESGPLGARPLDRLVQASSSEMPTRQIDKAEIREVVRMALKELSERQRMAVLLNKFEGMSYADIATAMELSPQAVKSLLSRAREKLRQILEPYFADGARPRKNDELSDSAVTSDGLPADDEE